MCKERCKDCKLAVILNRGDVHTLQSVGLGAMKTTENPEVDRTCLNFDDVVLKGIPQTIEVGEDDDCVKTGSFKPKA